MRAARGQLGTGVADDGFVRNALNPEPVARAEWRPGPADLDAGSRRRMEDSPSSLRIASEPPGASLPDVAPLVRWWLDFLDRRVPPALVEQGPEQAFRARTTVVAGMVAFFLWSVSALVMLALGEPWAVPAACLGSAAVVVIWLAASQGARSQLLFAAPLLVLAYVLISILWFGSGFTHVGALFGYSAAPVGAILLAGWRGGLVITALSCAMVTVSYWMPAPAGFAGLETTTDARSLQLVLSAVILSMASGAFATVHDLARSAAMRRAEQAGRDARESEQHARMALLHQSAVADISRNIQIADRGEQADAVRRGLETAGRLVDAEISALAIVDFATGEEIEFHTWTRGDPEGLLLYSHHELQDRCPWMTERIMRGETVVVRSPDDLPPEAWRDREMMAERGIGSSVVIPVRQDRLCGGFLCVELRKPRDWHPEEVRTLKLISDILAATVLEDYSERERRKIEARFAETFASHPNGLLLASLEDLTVLECNDRFLSMTSALREEVVGGRICDLPVVLTPELREELVGVVSRAEAGHEREFSLQTGCSSIECAVSAARVEIDDSPCVLVTVRDVTEKKELEAQLAHAQKVDAVGRLAGGVAHDFNNMLSVIQGCAETLGDALGDRFREEIDAIRDASERSADLTRQLLTFSRRQAVQPSLVDLGELVVGIEPMLRRLLGENIGFSARLESRPTPVKVDPSLTELAIVNLAINARDAMPGGGRLEIRTVPDRVSSRRAARLDLPLAAGAYVRLEIEDEGCGMSEELMARVLEPFFTTKEEGRGTGLGLVMVDRLAQQSGGAMKIESREGQGTTVKLWLPLSDDRPTRVVVDPYPVARGGDRLGTVLLVEDEAALRRLSYRALSKVGHEVIVASDGIDALEQLEASGVEVDLLVSDAIMPRMGGVELARRLRQAKPEMRAVFTSGYSENTMGLNERQPGDFFLAKPFTPNQLRECVDAALGGLDSG